MAVHSPIADNEGGNKQLAAAAAVTPTATAAANYFHVYVLQREFYFVSVKTNSFPILYSKMKPFRTFVQMNTEILTLCG